MSEYKGIFNTALKETRWTFLKGLPLFVMIVVILAVIGFGLNSIGLISSTIVKREVFKASYQRSSALEAKLATDRAVKAEIESRLHSSNLTSETRENLNAQLAGIRVRIATTKGAMK